MLPSAWRREVVIHLVGVLDSLRQTLDRYEGAALLSLDSFALVGGALRGGRIFNGIRHPWRQVTLGTLDGAVCP